MSKSSRANRQRAKILAEEVLSKLQQLTSEHNSRIVALNQDIQRTEKAHRIIPYRNDPKLEEEFYKYSADLAERIKLLNRKIITSEKIERPRRQLYEGKLANMASQISELTEGKGLKLPVNNWLIKSTQQLGQIVDEAQKNLILLEKQGKAFCFGGDKNLVVVVQKNLLEIACCAQFWQLLGKTSPLIQREVQLRYVELEFDESPFNDIEKMIASMWPEPELIEVPVQHIVQKIIYKEAPVQALPPVMISNDAELRDIVQKNQRLTKQLNMEHMIREAHQMLIGIGRPQNVLKATEVYMNLPEVAPSDGQGKSETDLRINPLICNILGWLYEQGKFLHRDLKKAVEYYIKSASAQDAEGLYKIGKFLEKKLVDPKELFQQGYANRKQELRDAIQHYEKAAQKGHLDAITDLGHIYENGIRADSIRSNHSVLSISQVSDSQLGDFLIQPNLTHALKYYQLAKKEKFPRALNNLGAIHLRMAQKIPQTMRGSNLERGIKYLKNAAELKYPKAFLNLGKCYEKGLGVKKNKEKAHTYFIEGAELGDNQCRLQFVKSLLEQPSIQQKADPRLGQFLRQVVVAEPDLPEALYLMSIFQERGIGGDPNPQGAFYWAAKASKLHYGPALVKLGDYYYSGYFVNKDISRARLCYEKGALQGCSQGFINLGLLYEKGVIAADSRSDQLQTARNYYLEAAKLGDSNAFVFLGHDPHDPDSLRKAAELGSSQALKILARTSASIEVQTKTLEKGKNQYEAAIAHFVRQTNKLSEGKSKQNQNTSPRNKQMRLHSPRQVSKYSQIQRQRVRSQDYFRL